MADASANTLDQDLNCLNCGYNLRGLPERGQCPECGDRICLSIEAANGNAIGDPQWARRTATGARLYAIVLVSALVLIAVAMALELSHLTSAAEGILYLTFAGGASAGAVAIWLSTTRFRHGWAWHLWPWFAALRLASVLTAASAITYCALMVGGGGWRFGGAWGWWQSITGGIAAWGMLITDALYMRYLGRLVEHVPGRLAYWGFVTSIRGLLVLLAACLMMGVSAAHGPGMQVSVLQMIVVFVLACAFVWPAIYTWLWSRRVSRLAGR